MKKINYKKGIGPLIIVLIVAVVLALGGGAYYASRHSNMASNSQTSVSTNADVNASASASGNSSGTIRDLLALGRNVMCAVDQSTATSSVKGNLYISGTMMRGDFTSSFNGSASMDSHMIRNGDTIYAWSGTQGAKMTTDLTNTSAQSKSNVNLDQKVNYSCNSWSPDSAKFSVPTDVHFTDVTAAAKSSVTAGASAGTSVSAQCSACGSLTGTAKSQCMAALHC